MLKFVLITVHMKLNTFVHYELRMIRNSWNLQCKEHSKWFPFYQHRTTPFHFGFMMRFHFIFFSFFIQKFVFVGFPFVLYFSLLWTERPLRDERCTCAMEHFLLLAHDYFMVFIFRILYYKFSSFWTGNWQRVQGIKQAIKCHWKMFRVSVSVWYWCPCN